MGLSLLSVVLSLRAQGVSHRAESLEPGVRHDGANEGAFRSGPETQEEIATTATANPGVPGFFLSVRSLPVVVEALFLAGNVALFIYFIVASQQWPLSAALLPRVVSGAGLVFLTCYLFQRFSDASRKANDGGRILDIGFRDSELSREEISRRILRVGGSLAALLAGVWLVGFHITIPLYLLVYCTAFGGMRGWSALIVAAGFEAFIVGVYDSLVHVVWNEPLLVKLAGIAVPFVSP